MTFDLFDYCISKPINSVYKHFFQRKIFSDYRQSTLSKSVVPDFLLETFECAREDRFILYNDNLEESPVYQCRFSPGMNSNIVMIAKEDGGIVMVNTELSGSQAIVQNFRAHKNCIFDVQWMGTDRILTSSGDRSIKYIDLNREESISQSSCHEGSVKSLALRPGHPNMFASSSRDGSILLWDLNENSRFSCEDSGPISITPINYLFNAHHPDILASTSMCKSNNKKHNLAPKSVTSTIFVNENVLASSGSADGKIKLWDIRKVSEKNPKPVKTIPYSGKLQNSPGFTDLVVNRTGTMLFAYCKDEFIYQYNLERPNYDIPVYQYTGHLSGSYYLKMDLSPDEKYLACGSSSYSPYIYHIGVVPQKPLLLNGHRGEVTVCRWCPTNQGILMSVSDDCTAMVHRMKPGSEFNVFYRNQVVKRSHNLAPFSLSSRSHEVTVTEQNQYQKPQIQGETKPKVHFNKIDLEKPINSITPQKIKDQSIKSFLSPMPTSSLFDSSRNKSTLRPLTERNIILPNKPKIDRGKSVLIKSNDSRKIQKKRATSNENEENTSETNLKRRKTISQPIVRFLQSDSNGRP